MRISGFSTGMDIDSMVSQLMAARKAPLDKLNQQKQIVQWQREAYREVSTRLVSFSNEKVSNLRSVFNAQAKTADLTGDKDAISVSVSNSASNYPVKVTVTQVASAARAEIGFTGVTRNTLLKDIPGYNSSDTTIVINGDIEVSFDPEADTIQNLVTRINSAAGAEVSAAFDSATGKLYLTSKTTGAASTVTATGGLIASAATHTLIPGDDAKYSINDVPMADSASNVIDYDGMKITFKDVGTATITTKADTDKLVEAVKSFVKDYNALIEFMNGKLSEERYRTFQPLTDEQKKEMKEDDIKNWTEKAQSGMLRNDEIVRGLVNKVREAVTGNVTTDQGTLNLNSLGLATGKWNEGGKLVIENEDQLRSMIEQDAEKVVNFFTGGNTLTAGSDTGTLGIVNRLSKIFTEGLDQLAEKAGTSRVSADLKSALLANSRLGEKNRDLEMRIAEMNRKLTIWENTYYRQFTAMETAINKMNSQSNSLSSFLQ